MNNMSVSTIYAMNIAHQRRIGVATKEFYLQWADRIYSLKKLLSFNNLCNAYNIPPTG